MRLRGDALPASPPLARAFYILSHLCSTVIGAVFWTYTNDVWTPCEADTLTRSTPPQDRPAAPGALNRVDTLPAMVPPGLRRLQPRETGPRELARRPGSERLAVR